MMVVCGRGTEPEAGGPGSRAVRAGVGLSQCAKGQIKTGRELVSEQDLGRSSLGLSCLCSGAAG